MAAALALGCVAAMPGARAAVPGDPMPLLNSAGLPAAASPPAPAALPAMTGSPVRARLDAAGGPVVGGEKLRAALLRRFYASHDFEPVWERRPAQAEALFGAVLRAEAHGLDPNLFHAAMLRNPAALSSLDRELLLSNAFLSYADALARGAMPVELRLDDEDLTPEPVDVAAVVNQAIDSADPASVIEGLAPRTPAYQALRRELQSYRAAGSGQPAAGPNAARIRELEIGLERQRWLPRHLPADRVWVNAATSQLVLYRNDQPVFTTRVIVGETDKQTPEFQTTITGLLFNPPWNVPYSIATNEILPKLARDPEYLTRHRMVLRANGGLQQLPGAGTALGRLKFEMPNRFDVYLHDTPMKGLFSRDNRRLSHGCIRVQNPRELAALLLEQPVDVVNKAIAPGTTNRMSLANPFPLFIVYQTAFLDTAGRVAFAPDVYERDDEVWRRLNRARQAPVAQHEAAGQRRG